ncbi:hypothetical protein CapIbe_018478 [Capra ibex]
MFRCEPGPSDHRGRGRTGGSLVANLLTCHQALQDDCHKENALWKRSAYLLRKKWSMHLGWQLTKEDFFKYEAIHLCLYLNTWPK